MFQLFRVLVCFSVLVAWGTPAAAAKNAPQPYLGDRLAYVSGGNLYVGFPKATLVSHTAGASHPAFSFDGIWLAFIRTGSSPSAQQQLWLMPADRSKPPTKAMDRVANFQWSASGDVLAVQRATTKRYSPVLILPVGAKAHFLPHRLSGDFAWSPDGQTLGVVNISAAGYAQLALVRGNTVKFYRLPRALRHDPVWLAGWWPNSHGFLYWLDPGSCISCITDGTRLLSYDLQTRRVRQIAVTLPYRDWIAPSGNRLLVVSGAYRSAFFGKHLQLCGLGSACKKLPDGGPHHISLDRGWAPNGGRLAFVVAPAWNTSGYRSAAQYRRWLNGHVLWTALPDGSGAQPAGREVPKGVQDPLWTRDGRGILFVENGSLWLDPHLAAADAHPIARLVDPRAVPNFNNPAYRHWYYGHMNWHDLFAWY